MCWVSRNAVAHGSAVGVVAGRIDYDPVGPTSHTPDTASEGVHAHAVVHSSKAVVRAGEAQGKRARSGVLADSECLAGDADQTHPAQVRWVGCNGVACRAAAGVFGSRVDRD